MAAKMSPISNQLLPYEAGFVKVTPLDANKQPQYSRTVITPWEYLTSTQWSESIETETVDNGNGQNGEFPTSRTHTLTVNGNVFSPIFHNMVSGKIETFKEKALMPDQFTWTLPTTDPKITFGVGKDVVREPAKDDTGEYHFVVQDNKGNVLTKATNAELGTFVYDDEQKEMTFSADYKGMQMTVTYDYEESDVVEYSADPILRSPEFLVETFGTVQDATSGETFVVYRALRRAKISGDLASQTSQKSKSAGLTYTFVSTPVPRGVVPWIERWAPDTGDGTSAASDNIVNGCDDNFSGGE